LPWQSDPADPGKNPGNSGPPPSQDEPLTPGKPDEPKEPQTPSDPSNPSRPGDSNSNPQPNPAPNPAPNPIPVQNPTPRVTPIPVAAQPSPTTIGSIGTIPIVINPTNPSQINIGTTALTPGSPALTLGPNRDTTISLLDPTHLIINTPGAAAPSTINLPQPAAPTPSAGAIITLPNGDHITATAVLGEGHNGQQTATSVLISGTLFSAGSAPITLANGLVLSQAPSGAGVVVINTVSGTTSTIPFSHIPGINAPGTTPAPTALVTIGGRVYVATSRDGSVVVPELGITLSAGGVGVTVNGTVVSGAGRTGVVVGSSTVGFTSPRSSPSGSGSGTGVGNGNGNGATATGRAARMGGRWWVGIGMLGALLV
tara:strand:- start:30653 stop:31762 length:1110 start_codon:yes stop_codon:yes gene_type:complete